MSFIQKGSNTEMFAKTEIRRRLFDMGITPGAFVFLRKKAPLGDPIEITIRGYELTLRNEEASYISVEMEGK